MTNCTAITTPGTISASPLGKLNPVWTPAFLPGLLDGWQSESNITEDAAHDVTAWGGIKGTKFNAAAGVTPNRSRDMNGKTGLVCASDLATTPTVMSTTAAPICVYAVWDALTDPDGTQQCLFSCAAFSMFLNFPGASNSFIINGNNPNGNITIPQSPAGRHVLVYYQPTAGNAVVRFDGVQVATKNSVLDQVVGALALGRFYGAQSNTATLDTAVGACGIAAGLQSLIDVQKLEGYLAQGWGSNTLLPVGHPYRSLTPRKLT